MRDIKINIHVYSIASIIGNSDSNGINIHVYSIAIWITNYASGGDGQCYKRYQKPTETPEGIKIGFIIYGCGVT